MSPDELEDKILQNLKAYSNNLDEIMLGNKTEVLSVLQHLLEHSSFFLWRALTIILEYDGKENVNLEKLRKNTTKIIMESFIDIENLMLTDDIN